jgi:Brp/Blh family beta-carotene 15,15'-monooxygenase
MASGTASADSGTTAGPRPLVGRRPATARSLLTLSRLGVAVLAAVGGLLAVTGVTIPPAVSYTSYLLGVLGLGLLYGGFELATAVTARTSDSRVPVLIAYLVLGALALDLFVVAPVIGTALALGLLTLSTARAGLSAVELAVDAEPLAGVERTLAVVVRGGIVPVVAYLTHPDAVEAVVGSVAAQFAGDPVPGTGLLADPTVRLALGGMFSLLVVAHLANGFSDHERADFWRWEVVDLLLLAAFVAVVPPLIAAAGYVVLWYVPRRLIRLQSLGVVTGGESPSIRAITTSVLRRGIPVWIGTLALFAAASVALGELPSGTAERVAFAIGLIAVVTVPHVLIDGWFDREENETVTGAEK